MASTLATHAGQTLDPEDWVDAYGDHLYRYAIVRLRDESAAEEVVQDTFLAGIRHQAQFSGTGSQYAWLIGILKNKVIDMLRLRAKQTRMLSVEEFDPAALLFDENGQWRPGALPPVSPDYEIQAEELWQVVQSCLDRLPPSQAAVFTLSVMEDLGTEEICKQLSISPSNLWVRMHRARLGLAKCVGHKWFADERTPQ